MNLSALCQPAAAALVSVALSVALLCSCDDRSNPSTAPPVTARAFVKSVVAQSFARVSPSPANALLLPDAGRPTADRSDGIGPREPLAHYRIEQRIDDTQAIISGQLSLSYPNRTGKTLSTVPLVLHPNAARELGAAEDRSANLAITAVRQTVTSMAGGTTSTTEVRAPFSKQRPTLVRVELPEAVGPSKVLRLEVSYRGKLRRLSSRANDLFTQALGSMAGLSSGEGEVDYGLLAVGDGILTAAIAYPLIPPFRDGVFDTAPPARLGDVAYNTVVRFDVLTRVPTGLAVVTNLVDSGPLHLPNATDVVASRGRFVRDFVLIAGRDLERHSIKQGSTRITSIYRLKDARAGRLALDTAVASLASFQRRFGPYPYSELDVAEASLVGGAGGVEFSAMVLVAGMLYRNPDDSSSALSTIMKLFGVGGDDEQIAPKPSAKKKHPSNGLAADELLGKTLDVALEFTVAHEVAHQYFAGIVGNDSRQYPSLDEPLAQYAAGLVMEDRHGQAVGRRATDMNVKLNYAVYRLLGGPDRPVLRDTHSYENTIEYAGLVYGKAPYLYWSLRDQLGAERLHRAIRQTVDRHRFQIVSIDQWRDSLEQHTGGPRSPVRTTFDRWLRQTHGDTDLAIGQPGRCVFDVMLPPKMAKAVRNGFEMLGMKPEALLRSLLDSPFSTP